MLHCTSNNILSMINRLKILDQLLECDEKSTTLYITDIVRIWLNVQLRK